MADNREAIRALLAEGRKIEAIRLYREEHDCGLREAKEAVEGIARSLAGTSPRPRPAGASKPDVPVTPDEDVQAELAANRKINAVALYRARYGVGLREAKEAVEAWQDATGTAPKSGCFIATAVFESADAPEVLALQRYRDRVLLRHRVGRAAARLYYRASPRAAAWFERRPWARRQARLFIRRLLCRALEDA